jgi:2-haloacid dehalogenase
MPLNRRTFIQHTAGAAAACSLAPLRLSAGELAHIVPHHAGSATIEAVLFDAFPIFDPRPVAALAETEFPGRGGELMSTWRTRQFEYQWLRAISNDYADFWQCTEDALRFAAASLRVELTPARRARLMQSFLELRPWPDVAASLRALQNAGVRLGMLSNFTPAMLDAALRRSDLEKTFEHVLSTDRARTYKPDPRAYQLGVDAFRLPRDRIAFAAFAGWDAAGAKHYGYPTFWVNRLQAPPEELGVVPDGSGTSMAELVTFVTARR